VDYASWLRLSSSTRLVSAADARRLLGGRNAAPDEIEEELIEAGACMRIILSLDAADLQRVLNRCKLFNMSELAFERQFGNREATDDRALISLEPVEELRIVCMADQGARHRTRMWRKSDDQNGERGTTRGTGQHSATSGQTLEINKFVGRGFSNVSPCSEKCQTQHTVSVKQ
jgi:hypothetical protein